MTRNWLAAFAASVFTFTAVAAFAQGDASKARLIGANDLLHSPTKYIHQRLRLSNLPCVDDPKNNFICIKRDGGRLLKIDGLILGVATSVEIAELLISDCTGTLNIDRSACVFDVEFIPETVAPEIVSTDQGNIPMIHIFTRQIDFFKSAKQ